MPTKMNLYICKDCKMLLLKLDERAVTYNAGVLPPNGFYITHPQCEHMEHDCFICPVCSGTSEEYGDLQPIVIPTTLPIELAKSILELWKRLKQDDEDNNNLHGIPIDNKELRCLIGEALV